MFSSFVFISLDYINYILVFLDFRVFRVGFFMFVDGFEGKEVFVFIGVFVFGEYMGLYFYLY